MAVVPEPPAIATTRGADSARASSRAARRTAAIMLALMMGSQLINHFDRAVVAIASADIMHDLGLSLEQYGLLASAFYSLFAISGLLVGMLIAHRVRARSLVTWLIGFWMVAQLPALLFPSFAALIVSRVILGAAESPSVAAAIAVTHEWYPPNRRNLPNSMIFMGSMLGAVIAPPLLIAIIASYGWKGGFVACTIASGFLLLALLAAGRDPRRPPSMNVAPDGPWWREFARAWRSWTDPRIMAITGVAFLSYWVFSYSSSWLFPMLHLGWGYGQHEAGWIVSLIYLMAIIPLLGNSWLSQRALNRGATFRTAVILPTAGTLVVTAALLACSALLPGGAARVTLVGLAFALLPSVLASFPIMVSRIAPDGERNRLLLMVLTLESSAGMVAPYASGVLIERLPVFGYSVALLVCGATALLGSLLCLTLFRPGVASEPTLGDVEGVFASLKEDRAAHAIVRTALPYIGEAGAQQAEVNSDVR